MFAFANKDLRNWVLGSKEKKKKKIYQNWLLGGGKEREKDKLEEKELMKRKKASKGIPQNLTFNSCVCVFFVSLHHHTYLLKQ